MFGVTDGCASDGGEISSIPASMAEAGVTAKAVDISANKQTDAPDLAEDKELLHIGPSPQTATITLTDNTTMRHCPQGQLTAASGM
jgi:hypothetical protein